MFDNSFSLSRWCQTDASNAISDLITAEYTCFTFVKIVSHVKTSRWLSASILVTWLTSICQRCASHCSFVFSWIFRTRTSDFNLIIELSICMLIIMLNFLNFLVKCIMYELIFFWCKRCIMNSSSLRADVVCFAQYFANFFNEFIIN